MDINIDFSELINAIVFSLIGILVFLLAWWLIDLLTPFRLWDQLIEKQNTALAIVAGAFLIGLAIIIASAHG